MLNIAVQKLLPKILLGKLAVFLSKIENTYIKNMLISFGTYFYNLDMQEALVEDKYAYKTVEALFIRKLKPSMRPIDPQPNTICSPCDGSITQIDIANQQNKIEAKTHFYTIDELLATKDHSFHEGLSTTIYLAPTDYHRVHMPMAGQITSMTYIPGKLYSVDPKICEKVPGILSLNERVIIHAKNDYGPFTIVMIGAINVGHIHINWHGLVNLNHPSTSNQWVYQDRQIHLAKGDEIGYFNFGSTVILLFDDPNIKITDGICLNKKIHLGQVLAQV